MPGHRSARATRFAYPLRLFASPACTFPLLYLHLYSVASSASSHYPGSFCLAGSQISLISCGRNKFRYNARTRRSTVVRWRLETVGCAGAQAEEQNVSRWIRDGLWRRRGLQETARRGSAPPRSISLAFASVLFHFSHFCCIAAVYSFQRVTLGIQCL